MRKRLLSISAIVLAAALGAASLAQAEETVPGVESGASGDPTTLVPPPPEVVERLHDIRGPVEFAPPWRLVDYAAVAGATLAGIALALIGWAVVRGRHPKPTPVAEPVPTAHETALAKLQELREQDLFERGGREGHLRLATEVPVILKAFLDQVYGTGSVYLTTTETHRKTGVTMGIEWGREVAAVLLVCDRVKFAGQQALSEDPITRAERIIRAVADASAQGSRSGRPAA